jgi:hypothetical protein
MTMTTDSPAEAPPTVLSPTLRQRLRANRGGLIIAAIIVAAAVLGVIISSQSAQQRAPLDPDSASQTGAKALVSVLRQHGVDVRTATTLPEADRRSAEVSPGDLTLLVYDPDEYLPDAKLAADTRLTARTVLVAPTKGTVDALRTAGADVAVISTDTVLQNQHITDGDNAGRAIRLLGGTRVLIWYTPSFADVGVSAPKTIADLTPPWVTPLIVLAAVIAAAAALWRGRRFGPLVVEDLPVVVRASESLEGRARLYQRSDARLHALDALRMGAIGRLAALLGLGPAAPAAEVCAAVAARLGRDPAAVRAVLLDEAPAGDGALVDLARRVAELEASVHTSITDRQWRNQER